MDFSEKKVRALISQNLKKNVFYDFQPYLYEIQQKKLFPKFFDL